MSQRWPIFSEPWWLDAVAPGCWREVAVEKGGQLLARMPYVLMRRLGFKLLTMPPLTQTLGPWIERQEGKFATRLSREHTLMATLIDGLPAFDFFMQQFHYSVGSWLPFYWEGFGQTTRYTYTLNGLDDQEALWQGLQSNIRREIRKAKRSLTVMDGYDVDTLVRLATMTFAHRSRAMPYDRALVQRVVDACRARDSCRILVAKDGADRDHSALLLVWDKQSAYYLIGGSDPDLRTSGAASLLMWEAIQLASTRCQVFDFEGSMIQPIERFFRGFGARPQAYHRVTKVNSKVLGMGLAIGGNSVVRLGRRLLGQ